MIFRIQNEKIDNFFCNLQDINFVKIDLRHAISVLVLDVRTGTFLFPKSTGLMRILTQLNTLVNTISPLFFVLLVQSCIIFVFTVLAFTSLTSIPCGHGHTVLDGDTASHPPKGHSSRFWPISVVAK